MGWIPHYRSEGVIYGKHIISQNRTRRLQFFIRMTISSGLSGRSKEGLGDRAPKRRCSSLKRRMRLLIPPISSSVITLKRLERYTLVVAAILKFRDSAIRTVAELAWKPTTYVTTGNNGRQYAETTGLGNAVGIVSAFTEGSRRSGLGQTIQECWNSSPSWINIILPGQKRYCRARLRLSSKPRLSASPMRRDDLTRENFMRAGGESSHVEIGCCSRNYNEYKPTDFIQSISFQ